MKHTDLVPNLFTVLHEPVTGRPAAPHAVVCGALFSAQVCALVVAGRLALDGDGLAVTARRPPRPGAGDPTGDLVVEAVAHARAARDLRSWSSALGGVVHDRVAEELVEAGVVRREAPRRLRPTPRWPAADPLRAGRARMELDQMAADPRSFDLPGAVAVACLLAAGVDDVLVTGSGLVDELVAELPPDVGAVVTALARTPVLPMPGGGRFTGSRLLVESAVLRRRAADPTAWTDRRHLRERHDAGAALVAAGRADEAVPVLEQAVAEAVHGLGPVDPDALVAEGNLAVAYLAAGRPEVGIPLLVDTLEDRERTLGPDHPVALTARDVLAAVHRTAGRPAEALAHYALVVAHRTRVLGAAHPHTLTSRLGAGLSHADDGDARAAVAELGSALRDAVEGCGPAHPVTVALRGALAECLESAGRPVEARSEFDRAARDAESALGPAHPDTEALRDALTG
ncbi:tetratricopeptide repeat protein [Pseudonocardia broussonetiae]|uniref:Tetratricopeptide repeat protein n=1 Tax=Pseudonocardia broussonetiae TaxID=2736640 RepID=A0A6M6JNZ0_9PSEU|nr:tetratricopeptide repeat protein [Pseudonocardia broussonetiae]QJY48302.1 tetratricopeptide repeat protein [Pseudonocardia broussonetiae]